MILATILLSPKINKEYNEYQLKETAKAAHPVSLGTRRFASSSQIKYLDERYTLTNAHVCNIYIQYGWKPHEIVGKYLEVGGRVKRILAVDKKHDLCLLQPIANSKYLEIASEDVDIHDEVRVIGHPRGLPQTIRKGRVINKGITLFPWISRVLHVPYLHLAIIAYPGNSGSPILNMNNELVGVLFAGQIGMHTETFVVPLEQVKDFLNRYYLGLTD